MTTRSPALRSPLLTMTARNLLLAHWPVDPESIRQTIPYPLELAVRDGTAWLSVVAFLADRLGVRGLSHLPGRTFPELRLQTYVRHGDHEGRYLFSVDAGDHLLAPLFRHSSAVPYVASDATFEYVDEGFRFRSDRRRVGSPSATFDTTYAPKIDSIDADDTELDRWLAEHRWVFGAAGGSLRSLDIQRTIPVFAPATATIEENDLFAAAGLPDPDTDPLLRFCSSWPMRASVPMPVRP